MILILFILITCYLLCNYFVSYLSYKSALEKFNTLLDDKVTCPTNAILYNNLCYDKAIPSCVKKATIIDGVCYFPDIFVCPINYKLDNDNCIGKGKQICPDGYNLQNNKCIKIAGQAICPDGSIPKGPNCDLDNGYISNL